MGTGDGAQVPFGPQPDTIPEIYMAPGSSERHSPPRGGVPVPPVTSVQPEAPDNLLEALRCASIVDEHRVLMDTAIEKVQFVKSGLTECRGLGATYANGWLIMVGASRTSPVPGNGIRRRHARRRILPSFGGSPGR